MNRAIVQNALCSLILMACAACHRSGTWVDDKKNWERAFGYKQPGDVKVVHSEYWRTPHFTYEAGYHFHILSNAALQGVWLSAPHLKPSTNPDTNLKLTFGHDRPAWFAPKPIGEYNVYLMTNTYSGFRLLIDKKTGDLFVTDSQ